MARDDRGRVHRQLAARGTARATGLPGALPRPPRLLHVRLHPEERATARPTAEQVFRLFSLAQRHTLRERDCVIRVFHPELTELQLQVLDLLGVPERAYGPLAPRS